MSTLHALLHGRKSEKSATAILYGAGMIPQDVPAVHREDLPWLKAPLAFSTSSANSCDISKCFNPLELNSVLQGIVLINSLAVSGQKNT